MPFGSTAEAVRAWVDGWVVSRGAAEPTREPWGFTVQVGLSKEVARHVLTAADGATVRKLAESSVAGVALKVFVPARTLAAWLPAGWGLLDGHAAFMAASLADVEATPGLPGGYRLSSWSRGGVTRVVVRAADGAFAARGQIAVTGTTAAVDQVETAPAHQRRGLGRAVLGTLAEAGAGQGARAAVLGATEEGRALYESVGWRVLAPLSAAMRHTEGGAP
ncbi:GNAT family N-acetyltransferase [Streptomyces sp. FXJ1.172]|uniref:GNAT family N-acetyltransferase n=1 Tax=Streptomyces sp. FXJ1.172 TaxID=710705 RepID=UPI0007CFD15B|nr:GNAT family N-acetyltransferase [Streptomyces sp. FXJ1.172]WEO97433.1 GNAT family N-acetyltransferase [Streptomyces sp. FXJ1.172]